MLLKYLPAALVAAGVTIGVMSIGTAQAGTFTNSSGDPFLGSEDVLYTSDGSPIVTPFGVTNTLVLHNFLLMDFSFSGGNEFAVYEPTFTTVFYTDTTYSTPTVTANLPGTFDAEIIGRTSGTETGTFAVMVGPAVFSGPVNGATLTTQIIPGEFAMGSVTITEDSSGVFTYTRVTMPPTEFDVNSGPFDVVQPITAISLPNSATGVAPPNTNVPAVAEPASLALLGVALAGMAFLVRRRGGGVSSRGLICNA